MRRWLLATVVALASVLVGSPASACSVGPGFDPRAATTVLVAGRVTAIELVRSDLQPPKGTSVWYRKLVTLQVSFVFKGAPPALIRFWDAGVAEPYTLPNGDRAVSWGGGGDCGTIESDPTGRFMAVALAPTPDGLAANILFGAVVTDSLSDPRVGALAARHGFALPSTSTQ